MEIIKNDIKEYVKENDIKFIRLAFCDVYGNLKNLSIMSDELENAFNNGVPFDASSVQGFLNEEESDLYLFPDASTVALLPWRPSNGRVVRFFCDIKRGGQEDFEDGRMLLKKAQQKAEQMGLHLHFSASCEFYLFKKDEDGKPTLEPFDYGGYLDMAPQDKGENIRREICLILEQMGIKPKTSHHEHGPGQNEIEFEKSNALNCADNITTFKYVVSTVADRNGLYACFLPKPLSDKSGTALQINMSLYENGKNLFNKANFNEKAQSFIAGILNRIPDMTLFLNSHESSYQRFGYFRAPKYISWSTKNVSQLLRLSWDQEENSKIQIRSADMMCNPYLVFTLLINAGLEGIQKGLQLSPAVDTIVTQTYAKANGIKELPSNIQEAEEIAANSEFVKEVLPQRLIKAFIPKR
ncbi:MAG TPA: glutamine synthetase family protein [Clostridia bacterium]|jgi:glutamine synthetase